MNLEKTKETSRGETEVSGLWEPGSLVIPWVVGNAGAMTVLWLFERRYSGRQSWVDYSQGPVLLGFQGAWVQGEVVQREDQAFILGASSVGDGRVTKVNRVKTS